MKLFDYIKDTRAELKHVNWPTRQQAIFYTIAVIVVSVGVAAYLGAFDYLFSTILTRIISQ